MLENKTKQDDTYLDLESPLIGDARERRRSALEVEDQREEVEQLGEPFWLKILSCVGWVFPIVRANGKCHCNRANIAWSVYPFVCLIFWSVWLVAFVLRFFHSLTLVSLSGVVLGAFLVVLPLTLTYTRKSFAEEISQEEDKLYVNTLAKRGLIVSVIFGSIVGGIWIGLECREEDEEIYFPYQLRHGDLPSLKLFQKCNIEAEVIDPWKKWLTELGFTWDRCYAVLRVSGPNTTTAWHTDRSNVFFWNIQGTKIFSSLRTGEVLQKFCPIEWAVQDASCLTARPKELVELERRAEEGDVAAKTELAKTYLSHEMAPNTFLWNHLLTPHWVEAPKTKSLSVIFGLSHGGLRYHGRLCDREDALYVRNKGKPPDVGYGKNTASQTEVAHPSVLIAKEEEGGGGGGTAEKESSALADLTNSIWLARHGKKESEAGECNWDLCLLSEGIDELKSQARRLATLLKTLQPHTIACSPFPRCIATAAIYAFALNIKEICIEPGLCEVLTSNLGMKGLGGSVPTWTLEELSKIAQKYGGPDLYISTTYKPVVNILTPESNNSSRVEVNGRASIMAEKVLAKEFNGWLFVTHGSPFKRMADVLALGKPAGSEFDEPPTGALLCLKYMTYRPLPCREWWLPPELISLASFPSLYDMQPIFKTFALAEYGWRAEHDKAELVDGGPGQRRLLFSSCPQLKERMDAHFFQLDQIPSLKPSSPPLLERNTTIFSDGDRTALFAVVHVLSPEQAVRNAQKAVVEAGLHGVFLINHGNSTKSKEFNMSEPHNAFPTLASMDVNNIHEGDEQLKHLAEAFVAVKASLPEGTFIGVNAIQCPTPGEQIDWVREKCTGASAVWIDDMKIKVAVLKKEKVGFGAFQKEYVLGVKKWLSLEVVESKEVIALKKARAKFNGLIFGGVAYKYLDILHHKQDEKDLCTEFACKALLHQAADVTSHYCDVLITSGAGTGKRLYPEKLKCLRRDDDHNNNTFVAFSGSSREVGFVDSVRPYRNAVLAATLLGVDDKAKRFLELDVDKMKEWGRAWWKNT